MPDRCPICSDQGPSAVTVHGADFEIAACPNCGILYQRAAEGSVSVDPYSDLFNTEVAIPTLDEMLKCPYATGTFEQIRLDLQSVGLARGRLLDIGCYLGLLMGFMRQNGWDVTGIDLCRKAIDWARSQGLRCSCTAIEDFSPDGAYDVIVLKHVLEHLRDPVGALRRMSGWLTGNGAIYVRVPNADSWGVRRSRRSFVGHLKPFEHLF